MSVLKLILIGILGGMLVGCQHKRLGRDSENAIEGKHFTITHKVQPLDNDIVYKEKRINHREKHKHPKRTIRGTSRDGAPSGPLPSVFQKVVPKYEQVSRYGNPDTYQVMGKKYEVMTNATGYKSRGIASWYGTKFHAGRTSSGEPYDMYALTAAHKTLPLPSYVRVKNLENGRVAIVKVNDRGPFHESRIMDLSYAAAVKLGVFPKGTAMVEIEALKSTRQDLHYYLQAGAYESKELAIRLQMQLSKLTTSPVYVHLVDNRYLVQLGPFAEKVMVSHLKQKLENNNIHGAFSMLM
jgi:rare lipoprotein A